MITGQKRYVSEMKGRSDWIGLDDGTRALPNGIPSDKQGFINSSTEEKLGYAKLFGKYKWGVKEVGTKPNLSLQIVKSLNIKLKEKQFISSLFSVSYNRSNSFVTGERNGYNGSGNISDPNYTPIHDKKYTDSIYNEEVIWSALGNVNIKINNRNWSPFGVDFTRSLLDNNITMEFLSWFHCDYMSFIGEWYIWDV